MAKNLKNIKKAIYDVLKNDATLTNLLGNNNIYSEHPPKRASYPSVIYDIITDRDFPYLEACPDSSVTETVFEIIIFSKKSTSTESDNIEARIKTLLQGQRTLDTTTVICYGCYRRSFVSQRRDQNNRILITNIAYSVQWADKPVS